MSAEARPAAPGRRRDDIQLLRAYAVLLVIAQHLHVSGMPAGFLGVDIFFVISGFLLTGIVDGELDAGSFSLVRFYARRARRLFPAAATTLAAAAIVAPLLLDASELRDFAQQALGALTFTINVVLWRQTDYFGSGAGLKPLLHYWSLAVEEQFYLVLPLMLLAAARRWRPAAVAVVTVASVVLCLHLQPRSPSGTFYLLPTRAWELGLGGLLALTLRRVSGGFAVPGGARIAAGAVLFAVPMLVDEAGHPGWPAMLVCIATAVLLVPGAGPAPRWTRPLVAVGDRSYSLYLVHWLPISFLSNLYVDAVPRFWTPLLVPVIALLGEAQYRLIERPLHRPGIRPRAIAAPILVAVVAVGIAGIAASRSDQRLAAVRVANTGLGYQCTTSLVFTPSAACRTSAAPRTLVWGDSVAMHLVPGLVVSDRGGIAQATRSICGPLLGIAPVNRGAYGPYWARTCLDWNDSVLASLARQPSVRVVVLSTVFDQYVVHSGPGWSVLVRDGLGARVADRDDAVVLAALERTVAAIRATGRRVVLVAPPPSAGIDVGRCEVRRAAGLPRLGPGADCGMDQAQHLRHQAKVLAVIARIRALGFVPLIDFDAALCDTVRCATRANGVILYRDFVHFSVEGSRYLGKRMQWGRLVDAVAR